MKRHLELYLSLFIILLTIGILLDTFVIEEKYLAVKDTTSILANNSTKVETDTKYEDNYISIEMNEYYENDTKIYVADIKLKEISLLQSAFAKNSYGKNVVEKTSTIADRVNAILAINGDYYGVQEKGYVLRNGVIYRNTSANREDLVIYKDGSFEIINEKDISLESLMEKGAYQVYSFGPSLVEDGKVSVDKDDEVGKAMSSNPRTAIGIINNNHYVFVVSDGRTNESEGLSLYDLATFMKNLNCTIAYNLDGGGSSTMVFNGKVINNPTTNGNRISERSISDIIYVGY